MSCTIGLERLIQEPELQKKIEGNIAFLCHSATITSNFEHGLPKLIEVFGERLKKVFGPQHGFVTDVQDNMIETEHTVHPYYNLPIYSLYSETRVPTDSMLEGIDHVLVDLADVGTRVYTYQSTMLLLMKACGEKNIKVTILDRPNPVGLYMAEGNLLEPQWKSFVGRLEIPQRHGLSMGELALFGKKYDEHQCELDVITVNGLTRDMDGFDINFPYVNPSPNLPTLESCFTFAGTVLFEGTNISEGRGTTRSLEVLGHPKLDPHRFLDHIKNALEKTGLEGFVLRPMAFYPMFQKHANQACGGLHIHPTKPKTFRPWALTQWLCKELYHYLGDDFEWNDKPYEYELENLAIDYINGSSSIREWIEKNGSFEELAILEKESQAPFLEKAQSIKLYQ